MEVDKSKISTESVDNNNNQVKNEDKNEEELDCENILPIKADFDNKAFELEEVNLEALSSSRSFDRQARPGTMMSMRSTRSNLSRSSINCMSKKANCPNLRLKKFFSYNKEGAFKQACDECTKTVLEKDGELIGKWLLIEINQWDLHKEKLVLLTEKTLIVISYDFIKMKILEYRRLNMDELCDISVGDLKYPDKSIMSGYHYGGIKLTFSGVPQSALINKINPFANSSREIILTSHNILYNEKERETELYNCDEFINSLELALSKLSEEKSKLVFKEEPIVIPSYASLISVLYNQNWLGFQLDRNGINF